jgi:hypothetical protein
MTSSQKGKNWTILVLCREQSKGQIQKAMQSEKQVIFGVFFLELNFMDIKLAVLFDVTCKFLFEN